MFCVAAADPTRSATALREHLLRGYDKLVVPTSERIERYAAFSSNGGTDIKMQIKFYKIEHVTPVSGTMRLHVWFRLSWYDPRLSWNESAWGGVTTINFNAASPERPEDTEIWLPDFRAYNAAVPMDDSLVTSSAIVYSSGYVFWSRPGSVELLVRCSRLAPRIACVPPVRVACVLPVRVARLALTTAIPPHDRIAHAVQVQRAGGLPL